MAATFSPVPTACVRCPPSRVCSTKPLRVTTLLLILVSARLGAAAPCGPTRFETGVPVTTCVQAEPRFASIRATMLDDVHAGRIASASVAVITRDGVLWEESIFVISDVPTRRDASPPDAGRS